MKIHISVVLVAVPLFSQPAVLDDWQAASITAVASPSGGPTTITTAAPHGLITGDYILIHGATASGANGQWVNMNTQQEVFTRMTLDKAGTTAWLSDTTLLEPTANSTWQFLTGANCVSGVTQNNEVVSISGFPTNRTMTLNGRGLNSTAASPHCPEAQVWGPLSRPAGYKITSVPFHWQVTVTGPGTFTIPLDSSTFGSFSGQTVFYERASSYASQPVRFMKPAVDEGSPFQQNVTANGTQQFVFDACNDKTNAMTCSLAYGDPDNQKGYGDWATTGSLVVSGGTGSMSLTAAFSQNTTLITRMFQPNELAWLWNFNEGALPFGTINRPWVTTTISGSPQTITFANMGGPACGNTGNGQGGACVPDGTYTVALAQHNFFFPIFQDYYAYWNGFITTSGCTPTDYSQSLPSNEFPSHQVLSYGAPYTPTFNRFRLWFQWGRTFSGFPMEWGTYTCFANSLQGPHGYHTLLLDAFSGEWDLAEYTAIPDHYEGAPPSVSPNTYGDVPQGAEPILAGFLGYPGYNGGSFHYMDYMHVFYLNGDGRTVAPGAQTGQFGPMYYDTVTNEPDEWTPSRTVTYNPTTGKYHVGVTIPGSGSYAMLDGTFSVTYDFYHSSTSAKTNGLNNSIFDGSAVSGLHSSDSTVQAINETASASLASTTYIQIVPHMLASGLSSGSGGNVSMSFRADPNMSVGDHVTASGFGGNTAANFSSSTAISAVQARQIWYLTAPGTSNPGQLSNITCFTSTPNFCTVNLTASPNVFVGQGITVSGVTAGGPGNYGSADSPTQQPTGAVFYTITSVGTNSFSFNCAGCTASSSGIVYNTNSTTGCTHCLMGLVADPFVTFNVTNSGTWDGNFTGHMVTAETTRNFAEINFTPPTSGCQFATTSLPIAHIGSGYSQQLSTVGCVAPAFSVSLGTMPTWASLNSATGALTGTPTGATPSTSSFTVAVSDANGNPTQAFALTTDSLPVVLTSSPLPAATVGLAYSQTFAFSAGDTPITCTATGIPAGLNLSSSCVLSGTPTSSGAATINVTATNSSGDTQAGAPTAFALTINPASSANCSGTVCPTGQVTITGASKSGH